MSSSEAVRVLIVDDRPDKLLALEAVLAEPNTEVVSVRCGRDALRQLLHTEFAVILMDINMPDMDGFETATLIRQRGDFRHTPIIFFTADDNGLHALKCYSLGAVDYITTPIQPKVLRAKVGVFIELARKSREIELQAESLRKKAAQLQSLASASVSLTAEPLSLEGKLRKVVQAAREIIGVHQAIVSVSVKTPRRRRAQELVVWSLSEHYAAWRDHDTTREGWRALRVMRASESILRLTEAELNQRLGSDREPSRLPWRGVLAVQLVDASAARIGVLEVSHKNGGELNQDDEAILVQLAQLVSGAVQNWCSEGAREANRIKDEFLGILSHELRTPLHAILGWTQHLRLEAPEGSDIARGLDVIERNVKGQTALVEDLLDVSRITSGKLHIEKQRLSLRALLMGIADACRPLTEAKKQNLEVQLGDDEAALQGDPNRLMQVFNNLLSNAIKFTPAGGRITLQMGVDEGDLVVGVRDTGEGISAEFLPFVFERFRQRQNVAGQAQSGLGLGLAIVRHIVELHGGHVDVESEGLGKGATFLVRIPRTENAGATDWDRASDVDRESHRGELVRPLSSNRELR